MKNMYDTMPTNEAQKIWNQLKFILKNDYTETNDDCESRIVMSCYSGKQTFGATDYKDHRNDSAEMLKKLCYKSFVRDSHQRGHYYNNDGSVAKTLILQGYHGGYTSYLIYNNKNGFNR